MYLIFAHFVHIQILLQNYTSNKKKNTKTGGKMQRYLWLAISSRTWLKQVVLAELPPSPSSLLPHPIPLLIFFLRDCLMRQIKKFWQKFTELGLTKRRGWLGAPMILQCKKFTQVECNCSLIKVDWLDACIALRVVYLSSPMIKVDWLDACIALRVVYLSSPFQTSILNSRGRRALRVIAHHNGRFPLTQQQKKLENC